MRKNLPVSQNEAPFPLERYLVSKTDLKGVITYANDAFVQISGYSREELIGQPHNLVRHPDMPPQAFQDLWETVERGEPWSGIVKNRTKNGDFYWVNAFVVPLRQDGAVTGYMSVRTEPSREQIQAVETLYRQLNASGKALPPKRAPLLGSLRAKFAATLGVALLLFAGVGFVGLGGIDTGHENLHSAYHEQAEPLLAIQETLALMDGAYKHVILGLAHAPTNSTPRLHDDPMEKHLDKIDGKIRQLKALLPIVEQHSTAAEEKPLIEAFGRATDAYINEALLPARQALSAGQFGRAEELSETRLSALYEEAKKAADALDKHIHEEMERRRAQSDTSYRNVLLAMAGIGFVGMALLGLMAWLLVRAVNRPIQDVAQHFNLIAEGILTDSIDISVRDEFGPLYRSLAVMQTNIKVMLDNIRETVMALQQNSANLDAQMYMVTMQSHRQQDEVESVAATTEEFSQAVVEVAESARRASGVAANTQALVATCDASMNASMTANAQVMDTVNQSNRVISDLSQSIQKIGEVTNAIRAIAEQTNLLALNAAIEAARAGEAGRGFAVVADEVRKLAETTARSTADITALIDLIRSSAQSAVLSMDSAVVEVDGGVQKIRQSVSDLGQITDASREVAEMSQHISDAASQQAQAGEVVASSMEEVATMVEQNTQVAMQAAALSKDLMQTSQRLADLIDQFRLFESQVSCGGAKAALAQVESQADFF